MARKVRFGANPVIIDDNNAVKGVEDQNCFIQLTDPTNVNPNDINSFIDMYLRDLVLNYDINANYSNDSMRTLLKQLNMNEQSSFKFDRTNEILFVYAGNLKSSFLDYVRKSIHRLLAIRNQVITNVDKLPYIVKELCFTKVSDGVFKPNDE